MAHGVFFTHSLFKLFIPCWLVSQLPGGFRALLCPRVVSRVQSQFTFMRQLWLPARNQLQHLCPCQTHSDNLGQPPQLAWKCKASENPVLHTTGRDPASLFSNSVTCFIHTLPPFPFHHFFNPYHGTSLTSWSMPSQALTSAELLPQALFFI